MKLVRRAYQAAYLAIALAFAVSGLLLIAFAGIELWQSLEPGSSKAVPERFTAVLESIGLLTIAVAALELSQTTLEEEVLRESPISAPTRARRFLSRFMVVVVVALAIEFLVSTSAILARAEG